MVATSGTQGILYGLSTSMLNTKGSRKLQQPKNRTVKHSNPSGIKVGVTPSGKEARVIEVLVEGRSMGQGAEEGNHMYQQCPRDQTQGLYWLCIFSPRFLYTSLFVYSQSSQFADTIFVTSPTL